MKTGGQAWPHPIRIGISACLLGQHVRHDRGHKYQPWTRSLAGRIEWVPVCPEVELGLGTPREPIQLVGRPANVTPAPDRVRGRLAGVQALDSGFRRNDRRAAGMIGGGRGPSPSPRLVGVASGRDHTRRMRAYAAARLRELAALGLCGYVFKDRSPSCGLDEVPVVAPGGGLNGDVMASGTGLFARAFRTRFPRLPVAGEGRLRDPTRREEFLREVLAYARRRDAGR